MGGEAQCKEVTEIGLKRKYSMRDKGSRVKGSRLMNNKYDLFV
jgi:hypothetical protein